MCRLYKLNWSNTNKFEGLYILQVVLAGRQMKSYTGLSFVFHNHIVKVNEAVPAYMDIGMYEENESIPYSHSWNLIYALQEA